MEKASFKVFRMSDGTEFTVNQMGWNPPALRDRKYNSWLCRNCGYKWKGHRRIWREKRTPKGCPNCGACREHGIVKTRMMTT